MKKQDIESIWHQGVKKLENHAVPDVSEVIRLGRKQFKKSNYLIWFYLLLFTVIASTTAAFEVLNIGGYFSNPILLPVHAFLLFLAFGTVIYGIRLMRFLKRMEDPMQDLKSGIQSRITFFKTRYRAWMVLATLVTVSLSFAASSYVDNMDGHFPINHPVMFVIITLGMIVFVYTTIWIAHLSIFHDLKGYLRDLENETTDHTLRIKRFWKKNKWWIISLLILLFLLLTWTLIKGIQANKSFNTTLIP